MTTDQEAENVAASVLHLLTQRGKDAENWQRQAEDWKRIAEQRRTELADLLTDARAVIAERDELSARLGHLEAIKRELIMQMAEQERQIAELAQAIAADEM